MTIEIENQQLDQPLLPSLLPVLPLKNIVVFPMTIIPLVVEEKKSIKLVDDAMQDNRLILIIAQKAKNAEQIGPDELYRIGTAAIIRRLIRTAEGTLRIIVHTIQKVRVDEFVSSDPYLQAKITPLTETVEEDIEMEGFRIAISNLFKDLSKLVEGIPQESVDVVAKLQDIRKIVYLIALAIPLATEQRQELLELESFKVKMQRLIEFLQYEKTIRELGNKITQDTQERLSKAQKEYYLREQVKSIQEELGESDTQNEFAELKKRVHEIGLPEEVLKEAERELKRLMNMPTSSPDYNVIRTYLDWIIQLPWNVITGQVIQIEHAKKVLDEDHYDLEKIKDRILEHLAVKKLREERQIRDVHVNQVSSTQTQHNGSSKPLEPPSPSSKAKPSRDSILCFVGPPGVGKTSLAQSIARALGRSFVRIALGGLHDESEIRGHRRTYVGAMPGKVIQGIRHAKTKDPVFVLDEIDKVAADWRSNPAAALLEVLDPVQNYQFVDNYLGVPFDLSHIMFITTANTLDTIPAPLLDRMEVVHLSGYTDEEKAHIAQKYLIPRQLQEKGLTNDDVEFDETVIRYIIRRYTREAGVRGLEREISSICRKVARRVAEGNTSRENISIDKISKYLGPPKFYDEVLERTQHPGIATGLAWTPSGGDILFVEASMMPSNKEQLTLTGMLGDVMRESARAALSYVGASLQQLGLPHNALEGKAIHLHVPAGSVPKDGPSAGVTMVTALVSLLRQCPVNNDIAMTGEITLRGKVLPVGGIKEKVLAAHRAGIKKIILPKHNQQDLEEVPEELKKELHFIFVDFIDEVLKEALPPTLS